MSCTWWGSREEAGGRRWRGARTGRRRGESEEGRGKERGGGKGRRRGRGRGEGGGGPAVWGFKDTELAARKGSVTEAEDRLRGPSVPDAKAAR